MVDVKTEVKHVDKTAESTGVKNVGPKDAAATEEPKTLTQVRAEREAAGEAGNAPYTAYPPVKDKDAPEPKPSPKTLKEQARGGEGVSGASKK